MSNLYAVVSDEWGTVAPMRVEPFGEHDFVDVETGEVWRDTEVLVTCKRWQDALAAVSEMELRGLIA